jgi:hypothetical protein
VDRCLTDTVKSLEQKQIQVGRSYLRNKTIRHWKTENTGKKGGASEEKEVPVKTAGLFEGELSGLGRQAAHILAARQHIFAEPEMMDFAYMIIIKKYHSQEAKWNCHEYPFHIKIPEVDQPPSGLGWMKGLGDRQLFDVRRP